MSVSDQTQKSECATGKSALPSTTGIVGQTCQVRKVPPYSLRSGFTAYFELSIPGERLFCHRRSARSLNPCELDASTAASGPHDFAVRSTALVSRGSRVHRISPHVRDDGQRPSSAVRRAELRG